MYASFADCDPTTGTVKLTDTFADQEVGDALKRFSN
jgi:hypothetical protein